MSDAIEPRPSSPFVPERALTPLQVSVLDPLAGDWSEGLRGPVRALDVPAPLLLALDGLSHPAPLAAPASAPPVAPAADEVEAPDAWDAAVDDPLQSAPPPALAGLPDGLPDLAPAAPAPVPLPGAAPAVAEEGIVELRAEDAADDAWSSPPAAAEPIQEWIPDAAGDEWQEVKKPEAPVLPDPPAPDWGTLSSGPDWTTAPAEAAPADAAWGMAPPPSAESAWDAVPAAPENPEAWEPPSLSAAPAAEWPAPEAPEAPEAPAAAAPAWNAPAVGASALEQLDSEPVEPTPGAAAELFGSVPMGAALAEDDELASAQQADEPVELGASEELGPSEELDPSEELGAPEELAAPEEVLRPVEDFDDPDLLVPIDEEEPPPAPQPQPLAMMQPASLGALAVAGEHRVAVHTRGGRTRRGSVRDIDLSKSQFPLIPQGGGAPEPVYHAEVKAIFFMLAPGEKPAAADGGKVRVTFADGRTIEGTRDGADAKHGFFLIPADAARTNTRRIYVAREATTDIKEG